MEISPIRPCAESASTLCMRQRISAAARRTWAMISAFAPHRRIPRRSVRGSAKCVESPLLAGFHVENSSRVPSGSVRRAASTLPRQLGRDIERQTGERGPGLKKRPSLAAARLSVAISRREGKKEICVSELGDTTPLDRRQCGVRGIPRVCPPLTGFNT